MPANLTSPRPPAAARAVRFSAPPRAAAPYSAAGALPRWRALLESRWQSRLRQLTELSLAYHDAAAAMGSSGLANGAEYRLRGLMRRAVAARRALADVEEALARLAAGRFGRCEQCAAAIPAATLSRTPEARYCPGCASGTTADLR